MPAWITDRTPTQLDGDLHGMVLWGKHAGLLMDWRGVRAGEPWAHSSAWREPAPEAPAAAIGCRPTSGIGPLMEAMPAAWRKRWCLSGACACTGCANISGGLEAKGYTREDHQQWLQFSAGN